MSERHGYTLGEDEFNTGAPVRNPEGLTVGWVRHEGRGRWRAVAEDGAPLDGRYRAIRFAMYRVMAVDLRRRAEQDGERLREHGPVPAVETWQHRPAMGLQPAEWTTTVAETRVTLTVPRDGEADGALHVGYAYAGRCTPAQAPEMVRAALERRLAARLEDAAVAQRHADAGQYRRG